MGGASGLPPQTGLFTCLDLVQEAIAAVASCVDSHAVTEGSVSQCFCPSFGPYVLSSYVPALIVRGGARDTRDCTSHFAFFLPGNSGRGGVQVSAKTSLFLCFFHWDWRDSQTGDNSR